jgi:hypothetical protein
MGRRARRMLARLEGLELIVESMIPRLKYIGLVFFLPEWFARCASSELPNEGTLAAQIGCCSY